MKVQAITISSGLNGYHTTGNWAILAVAPSSMASAKSAVCSLILTLAWAIFMMVNTQIGCAAILLTARWCCTLVHTIVMNKAIAGTALWLNPTEVATVPKRTHIRFILRISWLYSPSKPTMAQVAMPITRLWRISIWPIVMAVFSNGFP